MCICVPVIGGCAAGQYKATNSRPLAADRLVIGPGDLSHHWHRPCFRALAILQSAQDTHIRGMALIVHQEQSGRRVVLRPRTA